MRFVILLSLLYLFLGCESKSRKKTQTSSASNELVDLNKKRIKGADRKFLEGGSGITFHFNASSIRNVNSSWSTEEATAEIESSFRKMVLSVDDAEELIGNDFRGMEIIPSSVEKILSKSNGISLWEGGDEDHHVGKKEFIQSLLE
ncbi:MAG: hypothetical protein VX407_03980, partial [Verrucomicrobiota bacterium]|nr:hypothetical protein [Verrucomicrobiota bacterium]